MRRIVTLALSVSVVLGISFGVWGASASDLEPVIKPKYITGSFTEVTADGDTLYNIVLMPIVVYPDLHFKDKKQEQFYWRTVRDVKKALPYAKLICRTLTETYEYIETLPDTEARERHIKEMEGEVFKQYKPVLKKFTKKQANLLVKLIQRETNQSSYAILKAFLGSFRASFWQGFGKLFGVSLKNKYRPESDPDDALIERICVEVERGLL